LKYEGDRAGEREGEGGEGGGVWKGEIGGSEWKVEEKHVKSGGVRSWGGWEVGVGDGRGGGVGGVEGGGRSRGGGERKKRGRRGRVEVR